MKQVDFYLISNRVNDAKYKLASRLANKLQRLGQSTLVVTDDAESTAHLDRVMWSFSDTSFLAHDQVGATDSNSTANTSNSSISRVPTLIGESNMITPGILNRAQEVLINLSSEVLLFNHHFARIAEIIEQDDAAKAAARIRYRSYQAEGFEVKTHEVEL